MFLLRSLFVCRLAALCLSAAMVGCAISPKPEPPDAAVGLDPGGMQVESDTSRGSAFVLRAEPGSASPAGATVRVYNLDSDAPPVETVVQADGSFEVVVAGNPEDELRVQIIGDEERSDPADIALSGGALASGQDTPEGDYGTAAPETPGAAPPDCVSSEPPAELVIETSGVITIRNGCELDVQVDAPYPRAAAPGIVLGPEQDWPATLAPGAELALTVEIDPTGGFVEEILIIPLLTEPAGRIAITVHVPD